VIDRRRRIAYRYFEINECDLLKFISKQIEKNHKLGINSDKIYIKDRFISGFNSLFGVKDTLMYFIEWVMSEKKINLPENTTFVYRSVEWMRDEGMTWTQIISIPGTTQSIKWVYSNGELIEVN
jgi:hypothetical protein